jgi:Putative lumazine-binding
MKALLLSTLVLTLVTVPATAQDNAAAEQEVRQVVAKLFDGMRARDTAAIRSVFDSGARLVGTGMRNGAPVVNITPISDFIRIIGTAAPGQLLDERLENTTVQISDNLASVWTDYKFYIGEQFSHCGVDAFHLAKGANGWKIVALADTRRVGAQCE